MSELETAARLALEALEKGGMVQLSEYQWDYRKNQAIDALRSALERNKSLQLTHAEGCWSWGPQHYMCCYNEVGKLRGWRADAN